jgi:hypothetical protein
MVLSALGVAGFAAMLLAGIGFLITRDEEVKTIAIIIIIAGFFLAFIDIAFYYLGYVI